MITLDKQQVIQSIEKVLDTSKVGVLSTAYNNQPNSRCLLYTSDAADE